MIDVLFFFIGFYFLGWNFYKKKKKNFVIVGKMKLFNLIFIVNDNY